VAAAILIDPFYFTHLIGGIPLPVMVVGWLFMLSDITAVLNPVPGDNVGHLAHLGGYIAITVIVFLLGRKDRKNMMKGLVINLLLLALAVTLYNLGLLNQIPVVER
jgi:membrane associated rhomboid family serine protease